MSRPCIGITHLYCVRPMDLLLLNDALAKKYCLRKYRFDHQKFEEIQRQHCWLFVADVDEIAERAPLKPNHMHEITCLFCIDFFYRFFDFSLISRAYTL